MQPLSRRNFTRRLFGVTLLPVLARDATGQWIPAAGAAPARIAGYTPSDEEREAATRFLAMHEQAMAPLRSLTLPNGLAPATVFRAARLRPEPGGRP